MKVWNTTKWEANVKAGGKIYSFIPFEEKEIYNVEHCLHIHDTYGYLGLTMLNYDDDGMKKTYKNFVDFKSAMEVNALKKTLEHWEKLLASEINAKEACVKTAGAEHELRTFKVDFFEDKVKNIKQWLKEAGYVKQVDDSKKKEDEIKRPDWKKEVKDVNVTTA